MIIAAIQLPLSVQIAIILTAFISGFIFANGIKIPGEDDRYREFVDECARTDWLIRFVEKGGKITPPAGHPLIRTAWTLTTEGERPEYCYVVGSGSTPRDAIADAMKTFDLEKWGPKS